MIKMSNVGHHFAQNQFDILKFMIFVCFPSWKKFVKTCVLVLYFSAFLLSQLFYGDIFQSGSQYGKPWFFPESFNLSAGMFLRTTKGLRHKQHHMFIVTRWSYVVEALAIFSPLFWFITTFTMYKLNLTLHVNLQTPDLQCNLQKWNNYCKH